MRFSYVLVIACLVVGGFFPALAGWLLVPPLAVGLVVLGIAHGACDHLLLPAAPAALETTWGSWWYRALLSGYVALAGVVLLAWWAYPTATLLIFFGLSAWHWGSADAAEPATAAAGKRHWWLLHSLTRGGLLFAVPALARPTETLALCNDVLMLTRGTAIPTILFGQVAAVLGAGTAVGLLALWLGYGALGWRQTLGRDVGETALLIALLVVLPPALASGVYFVCWHSLRHVRRLMQVLPTPLNSGHLHSQLLGFWKNAFPLLAVSVAGMLAICWWMGTAQLVRNGSVVALLLVAASVVTLPHALLVTMVMDQSRWRTPDAVSA